MSWTQPICAKCWRLWYVGRPASVVSDADGERCSFCGIVSFSGIYVRRDPATVPYPSEDE